MNRFINTFFICILASIFASCNSEEGVEFVDNSDTLNKEFGVSNQVDKSWLESLMTSDMPYAYKLVESVEYSKQDGTWAINTGVCPHSIESLNSGTFSHWAPKTVVFKDGNIYQIAETKSKPTNTSSIMDLCCIAYKNDSGMDLNFYYVFPLVIDGTTPAIKSIQSSSRVCNIVELTDNTLIVKESYANCFSLTKLQFAPYFEFADGVYGSEVRFVSETLQGCWTKFFEVFKKHFGDKVNLSKLAFNGNNVIMGDIVTTEDISMAELEEYLRENRYID